MHKSYAQLVGTPRKRPPSGRGAALREKSTAGVACARQEVNCARTGGIFLLRKAVKAVVISACKWYNAKKQKCARIGTPLSAKNTGREVFGYG